MYTELNTHFLKHMILNWLVFLMTWSGSLAVMPGKGSLEYVHITPCDDCIQDCLLSVLRLFA